jgi:transposase-like protein
MEKRKRRRFTAEYKAEAVKRLEESGKPLQAVADELGVHAQYGLPPEEWRVR